MRIENWGLYFRIYTETNKEQEVLKAISENPNAASKDVLKAYLNSIYGTCHTSIVTDSKLCYADTDSLYASEIKKKREFIILHLAGQSCAGEPVLVFIDTINSINNQEIVTNYGHIFVTESFTDIIRMLKGKSVL